MAQATRPVTAVPYARKTYSECGRCKKTDHPEEACISKHDINNNRLTPLPDDVYGRRKAAYFKLKEQSKAAIEHDASPRTSDDDAHPALIDDYEYDDECDCVDIFDVRCIEDAIFDVCCIVDAPTTNVPAAPLVGVEPNPGHVSPGPVYRHINLGYLANDVPDAPLIGVEPNPGPVARREKNTLAVAKRVQAGRVQPLRELSATTLIVFPTLSSRFRCWRLSCAFILLFDIFSSRSKNPTRPAARPCTSWPSLPFSAFSWVSQTSPQCSLQPRDPLR
jgi:hypothetical protein